MACRWSKSCSCASPPHNHRELGRLAAHTGPVRAVAFSPGGDRLATGGADTTALVWDVKTLLRAAAPRPVRLGEQELESLRKELVDLQAESDSLRAQWEAERRALRKVQELREELERLRQEAEQAERDYDLNRAAELRLGRIPDVERRSPASPSTETSTRSWSIRIGRRSASSVPVPPGAVWVTPAGYP